MQVANKSLVGPGRFQWNAGAWFGSTIGGTAWMLVTTCFLGVHGQSTLASVPAIGYAIVWAAALVLWARRGRVYPFTALMTLLGVLAAVLPAVWILVSLYASPTAIAAMNWPRSIGTTLAASAIAPVLMLWFAILERATTPQTGPQ